MFWSGEEEDEDLMFSPALMARRASESWINTPPVEVSVIICSHKKPYEKPTGRTTGSPRPG